MLECDFIEVDLEGASFKESILRGSIFEDSNLMKANFIDAQDYNINIERNRIKKAKFSSPEVISLLNSFDIKIF